MFHGTKPGWIEVISGVMFSGKSEELIRRVRRAVIAKNKIQVFKSHLDARYAGIYTVSSHDGTIAEAEPINEAREIMTHLRPDTQVVAVDEAQFLDAGIVAVANALADRGVRVILSGLDTDFRAEPFGAMPHLDGRGRDRGQAARHLRGVRRAGDPQPAAGQRQARALRLPADHGGGARVVRGALPPLPRGAPPARGPG